MLPRKPSCSQRPSHRLHQSPPTARLMPTAASRVAGAVVVVVAVGAVMTMPPRTARAWTPRRRRRSMTRIVMKPPATRRLRNRWCAMNWRVIPGRQLLQQRPSTPSGRPTSTQHRPYPKCANPKRRLSWKRLPMREQLHRCRARRSRASLLRLRRRSTLPRQPSRLSVCRRCRRYPIMQNQQPPPAK